MPSGIEVNPSHRFGRRFTDLQYFYSTCKTEEVYFIRAVPDLIFTKKGTLSVAFVYNDTDLAEIKLGGRLPCSGGRPNAYAQISASLYFVATTKIIRALREGTLRNPAQIKSNGLLLNKNTEMLFFCLEATVGDLDVASLTVKYKRASFIHEELTLGLVCTGISETVT